MIIVSQDKTKSINFKRLNYIQVSKVDENKSIIEINHSDCNYLIIAEYKTEERAKEVLKDIISRYEVIELFKMNSSEKEGYTLSDYTPIYEMPEE